MLRSAILALSLALAGCQVANAGAVIDPLGIAPLRLQIPTDAKVVWETCGEVNAGYMAKEHTIVLCNELRWFVPVPVQRAILAHEMAHAYFAQRDVPFTGSEEAAADELAYIALAELGDREAIRQIAMFYYDLPPDEGDADSDHPSNITRAVIASCHYIQSGGEDIGECPTDYERIKRAWNKLRGQ